MTEQQATEWDAAQPDLREPDAERLQGFSKAAKAAIAILQGHGLQVEQKPRRMFQIRNRAGAVMLHWVNTATLVDFAFGVEVGIQIAEHKHRLTAP